MSIFKFSTEYNQRMPPKKKDGSIVRFSRNKGYESIPRELAQNENLSYEARGLLISVASYPETFKLYKCELYKRSYKNSRRKIDRCWEELIDEGFVLQFRKRDGKSFVFSYLFSLESFDEEDILQILQEAYDYNFHYYHKMIRKYEDQTIENILEILPHYLKVEEKQRIIVWLDDRDEIRKDVSNVQNEHPKEPPEINDFYNAQYEQLKMDCSKRTNNKLINNKFTTNKNDTNIDTEKIDTEQLDSSQLFNSIPTFLSKTFLPIKTLELIVNQVSSLEDVKSILDILYKSKKYVEDHLDGLTIVAEYFENETHEMLQRFFFKKRTKKLTSEYGYLYNVSRNHWLQMAGLLINSGNYPKKELYLKKCQILYGQLNKNN